MTERKNEGRIKLKSSILCGTLALAIGASAIAPTLHTTASNTGVSQHASEYINLETGKIEYTLPVIASRNLWQLSQRTITVNGTSLSEPGVMMNGTLYLPLRAFANSLGNATVSYNKSTKTATLEMPGLKLTATDAGFVTYANDRALFSFSPNVLMSNGRMYLTASVLTKALGVEIKSQDRSSVSISGSYTPLLHASKFYREDEVYWLAKIISAESGGESLIGQIAVGDVSKWVLLGLGMLFGSVFAYAGNIAKGLLVVIREWKHIHCAKHKFILILLTWPLYDMIYAYLCVASLFMRVKWKPIKHDEAISIEDIKTKK